MPPMFERLASVSRSTCERVFAHDVTIYPVARSGGPNGRRTYDPAAAYPTTAIFYENSQPSDGDAQPVSGGRKMLNRAARIVASIRLVEGKSLRSDYFMVREDGEIYEIGAFDPDGLGGVLAAVSHAQSLPEKI